MTWYELLVEGDERLYAEGSAKVVWMESANRQVGAAPRGGACRGKLSAAPSKRCPAWAGTESGDA